MKTKYFLSLFLVTSFLFTACKNNKKDTQQTKAKTEQAALQPDTSAVTVKWVAYKTTAKAPVNGAFKSISMANFGTGSTWKEVLNGATFTIDALKFSTGDAARDQNLTKGFFEQMAQPGKVSGKFVQSDSTWTVQLEMNGVTVNLPVQTTYTNKLLTVKATVNLEQFKALDALAALNKICGDLHKGKDGVSKTWKVVDVTATLPFK